MKIFLIGYGKMGRRIHELAKATTLTISGYTTGHEADLASYSGFQEAEAVIEFTRPDSALQNLRIALVHNKKIVSGTTGWEEDLNQFRKEVTAANGHFFYASNFSVGAHIMFGLNRRLAMWMDRQSSYVPGIHEIHHTEKLDKPSGTAKTLANGLLDNSSRYRDWSLDTASDRLRITCDRQEGVRGIHEVTYKSSIDEIMIRHEAYTRDGFAQGALDAAKWLDNKDPGCYGMDDMLPLDD